MEWHVFYLKVHDIIFKTHELYHFMLRVIEVLNGYNIYKRLYRVSYDIYKKSDTRGR